MLLKDTQVICAGPDNLAVRTLVSGLRAMDVQVSEQSQWQPHFSAHPAPVIWLLVFEDQKTLLEAFTQRFHAAHESCVHVLLDMPRMVNQKNPYPVISIEAGHHAVFRALLKEEQAILQRCVFQSPDVNHALFGHLHFYGRSPAYVETTLRIEQFAATSECVLIRGETGTGKELTARAIHYLSARKDHPFIPINCGAFTDELFLSELFGYEKGAFTGANKARKGLLEVADKGTVFLDEVDSLSPKAQVALLRYLQDSEIRPVGSNEVRTVDVRVVAASNQNIPALCDKGDFREDLMYRLDVLSITLPPLRERDEDIQLLAQYFLAQVAADYNHYHKVFSLEVIEAMQSYTWPGNVRELENFVKRAYLLSKTPEMTNTELFGTQGKRKASSLAIPAIFKKSFSDEKQQLVNQFEKNYLHYVLQETQGNISKAANIARKERRSFCRLMKKHGLDRNQYL